MELKHSFNLLASRYTLLFKLLIYFIIITAIFAAIMVSIMTPAMDPLFAAIDDADIVQSSFGIIGSMIFQQTDYLEGMEQLTANYNQLRSIISTFQADLLTFYILTTIVFFFYRLFVSMTSIPICDITNNYMNTSMHKSLISSFTENFWISLKYALVATLINQLINTGIGYMLYSMIMSTVARWGLWSFTVSTLVVVIILSLKYALLLGWIPIIVIEKKKVLVALKDSFVRSKRWFRSGFLSVFILYLFMMAATVLFGTVTFFVLVPIFVVAEMILLRIIELVCYYNSYKKRYYLDRNTIVGPREDLY